MTTNTRKLGFPASETLEKMLGALTFGKLIRAIREGEGLSQSEFADKLGLSKSHLCDIEKGRKVVSLVRAGEFAKLLGYPVLQFVRLAIQDELRLSNMDFEVTLQPVKVGSSGRAA